MNTIITDDTALVIYDNESGEVVDSIRYGESYKKTTKEQKEYLNSHKRINKDRSWCKVYESAGSILAKEKLTPNENAIIWGCISHIEYSTGILKMGCGCNPDRPLNSSDIMRICDIKEKTFYRAKQTLIEKKIFGETIVGKERSLVVNPFIFYKGKKDTIPTTIYELFKRSKWNTNGE